MLRLRGATSPVHDFTSGSFQKVIDDVSMADPATATRVVLCSGKIYYDLLQERDKRGAHHVALVRLEQYYPFPEQELADVLGRYGQAEVLWVQEEPENQGVWPFIAMEARAGRVAPLRVVSRPASASPATGSSKRSSEELRLLLDRSFD